MHTYDYPMPALTADVVLLRGNPRASVLLVRRGGEPYLGRWALPGGFLNEYELPEDAARRELAEETGVAWEGPLVLVDVFGRRGRDPRGWTVTVAYLAEAGEAELELSAGDDAAEARWFGLDDLPGLAFDHDEILARALGLRAS